MLQCDGLVLRQGTFRLTADWEAGPGITALIGPSGGGKSTLLAAMAGFLRPERGRILWSGARIDDLPPARRPVSILFQDGNLFPHLTLTQNLGLALVPRLRLTAAEKGRVARGLAEVGLEGLADRRPGALSGGQAARAALARVLLADRPVVLLDEPFAALGPALRTEMLDLLADRLKGRTVLMVTHHPEDARRIAGQAILVAEGRADPPRPTADLLADPPPALAAYLGSAQGQFRSPV